MINLQTNFGGGKTHSMLRLALASGRPVTDYPQDIQGPSARSGPDRAIQRVG